MQALAMSFSETACALMKLFAKQNHVRNATVAMAPQSLVDLQRVPACGCSQNVRSSSAHRTPFPPFLVCVHRAISRGYERIGFLWLKCP